MKVIRLAAKTSASTSTSTISSDGINIFSLMSTEGFTIPFLEEPVKQTLTVVYNKDGIPSPSIFEFGNQGDHRVTWLQFNLDELLWNLTKTKDEERGNPEHLYERYNFKLAIKAAEETKVIEFDGKLLEIPSWLTSLGKRIEIILVIEEYQEDDCSGNVPDTGWTPESPYEDNIERFVSESFTATIKDSGFQELDIVNLPWENTIQLHTLIKPPVNCSLSDNGDLKVDTMNIGQKFDNLIRFLVFNKADLSAHVQDFDLYIQWSKDDKVYQVSLEKSQDNEDYPEGDKETYWISWIPTAVLADPGKWNLIVLGFLGDQDKTEDLYYYRFISNKVILTVANNFLIDSELDPEIIIYNSNFILSNGELLKTSDGKTFIVAIDEE